MALRALAREPGAVFDLLGRIFVSRGRENWPNTPKFMGCTPPTHACAPDCGRRPANYVLLALICMRSDFGLPDYEAPPDRIKCFRGKSSRREHFYIGHLFFAGAAAAGTLSPWRDRPSFSIRSLDRFISRAQLPGVPSDAGAGRRHNANWCENGPSCCRCHPAATGLCRACQRDLAAQRRPECRRGTCGACAWARGDDAVRVHRAGAGRLRRRARAVRDDQHRLKERHCGHRRQHTSGDGLRPRPVRKLLNTVSLATFVLGVSW